MKHLSKRAKLIQRANRAWLKMDEFRFASSREMFLKINRFASGKRKQRLNNLWNVLKNEVIRTGQIHNTQGRLR